MKHCRTPAVRGFTLVEIMVVVLIIGLLMAIAVQTFVPARERSRAKACIDNLKQIDTAKIQWAMDNKASDTQTPAMTDLSPTYIQSVPNCPSNGTYTINNIGTLPTCSIGADTSFPEYSHTLQ
jgi:prepilin-type N-terminal cleavage/methylation domain-containing protein